MTTQHPSRSRSSSRRLLAFLTLVVVCVGVMPAASASASVRFDGRYSLKVRNTTEYRGQQYRSRDVGSFILNGTQLSGRTRGRDGMVDIFSLRLARRPSQQTSQQITASGRVTVIDSQGRRSFGTINANLRFRVLRSGRIAITGPYHIRITSGRYPGAILYGTYRCKK